MDLPETLKSFVPFIFAGEKRERVQIDALIIISLESRQVVTTYNLHRPFSLLPTFPFSLPRPLLLYSPAVKILSFPLSLSFSLIFLYSKLPHLKISVKTIFKKIKIYPPIFYFQNLSHSVNRPVCGVLPHMHPPPTMLHNPWISL